MDISTRGRSPFYPGHPLPPEVFIGRLEEIKRIKRSVGQVALGKPQAVFLTGEYGIGKSSLASLIRYVAEKENALFGIHVSLGGAVNIEDVAVKTVEAALMTQAYQPTLTEKLREALSRYVGKQQLFGVSLNFDALRKDGPNISGGYLPFLRAILDRLSDSGVKGLFLILDEINGITGNCQFAHFIKGLVDMNALSPKPLPLLLMLCGVEERRGEMIKCHQPVERIFDIVRITPMANSEIKDFFESSFRSQGIKVDAEAIEVLCHYSAGYPKLLHIIGEETYWVNSDNVIDKTDALAGVFGAAEEVGKKLVDQQVLKAIKSKDYHSIIEKIALMNFDLTFLKSDVDKQLSSTEKKNFNNFLQRMKDLRVIQSGENRGEYEFTNRMIRLYLLLYAAKKKSGSK
jgi:hypothetical protein